MSNDITQIEAQEKLWRKGILVWKLNTAQKQMYQCFYDNQTKTTVINSSRRIGKTYFLACIALETAIRIPNATIHYACPAANMAMGIIVPTMRLILEDCPKDLKPTFHKQDRCFEFKNGSRIRIEGTEEGNADRLRGTSTNLGIVDEAGFVKDLLYVVKDIFIPQTMTTKGKVIVASTPPKQTGHPFVSMIEKAKMANAYIKMSILDVLDLIKNDPEHLKKHLDANDVELLKEESGGANSPTWRREYLAEIVNDTTHSVLPEFTDEQEKLLVKEWQRPKFYDAYTCMDPGFQDNTAILFAYYDFDNAKIVIEDEWLGSGTVITSDNIASVVRAKEASLWNSTSMKIHNREPVYMRIADSNNPIFLNDLRQQHNLSFHPARKDDKEAAINDVRIKIKNEKIIINPRCKNLIYQMKTVMWNGRKNSWERTKEAGHYDLIDALIYLVRMGHWHRNPYPVSSLGTDQFMGRKVTGQLDDVKQGLKDMFIKSKKPNKPIK